MQLPVVVNSRPFSVETTTGVMLPDGIFDAGLYLQTLNCFFENASGRSIDDVTLYLEGIGDRGVQFYGRTIHLPKLAAGSSVLCSWNGDFRAATPGKPLVGFRLSAPGFQTTRVLKQIFVSRTRFDASRRVYVCEVPEGTLEVQILETSGPRRNEGDGEKKRPGPWVIRKFSAEVRIGFSGQYGPLAFTDPCWWKVVAWIVAAVAGIAAVIFALDGQGTAKAGVQCDYDEKTGQVLNCRVPDPAPTTGPTEMSNAAIASAIASSAIKIGMGDAIDPWRRGQHATQVSAGEVTSSERVVASLEPLEPLEAGRRSQIHVSWKYERVTDKGVYKHVADETVANPQILGGKSCAVPDRVAASNETLLVEGRFTKEQGSAYRGSELYVTALIRSPGGLEFRLPLTDSDFSGAYRALFMLAAAVGQIKERRQPYLGTWTVYLVAQNVNLVRIGTPPDLAAQTIGGAFLSAPIGVTFRDEACPVLAADATFEVFE